MYYFDHVYPSEAARNLGAFHASDVPFTFGHVGPGAVALKNWPTPPDGPKDLAMSKTIMDYLVAFAQSGRPAPANLPAWREFDVERQTVMTFADGQARPAEHFSPGMFELQDAYMKRLGQAGQHWSWSNMGVAAAPIAPPS